MKFGLKDLPFDYPVTDTRAVERAKECATTSIYRNYEPIPLTQFGANPLMVPATVKLADGTVVQVQRTDIEGNKPAEKKSGESRVISERAMSTAMKKFFTAIESEVFSTIGDAVIEQEKQVQQRIAEMDDAIRTKTSKLEVRAAGKVNAVEGARHVQLEDLVKVAAQRLPAMLVGIAGSGKTHAAAQVAEALGLPFHSMSVGSQTSKSDIIGFVHAGGEYVYTLFRQAYEHGGVFLMDEIDAGNANVLIQVNAALSNEYCAFPDVMVKRHPDFVFVASANTFGTGANRQYVGRNQLDAATLDRFVLMEWQIDPNLESVLAGNSREGQRWYEAVKLVREKVSEEGLRVLVTPRATLRGATLIAAGVPIPKAADMSLFSLFPADKRQWARDIAKKAIKC